jgi:hypothetical protein
MARAPGDRFFTASALASVLRQFLANESQATGWLQRLSLRFT